MAIFWNNPDESPLPKTAVERGWVRDAITQYDWALEKVQDGLASQIERRKGEDVTERLEKYQGIRNLRTTLKAMAYSGEVNIDAMEEGRQLLKRLTHDEQELIDVIIRHTDTTNLSSFANECIGARDALINLSGTIEEVTASLVAQGRRGDGSGMRIE